MAQQTKFFPPRFQNVDANGNVIIGSLVFYKTATTTKITTYSDWNRATANTNPLNADSNGRFGPVFFDPDDLDLGIRVDYYDDLNGPSGDGGSGTLIYTDDLYDYQEPLVKADITGLLYPIIAAETSAGLVASDIDTSYDYHQFARYKVVNDAVQAGGAWSGTDNAPFLNNAAKVARVMRGGELDSATKLAGSSGDYGGAYRMWAPGGNYYIDPNTQVDLREVWLQFDGTIRCGVATVAPNVILGGEPFRPQAPQEIFGVLSDDDLSVTETNVDCQISGAQGQTVTIHHCGVLEFYSISGEGDPAAADGSSANSKRTISYNDFHVGLVEYIIVNSYVPQTAIDNPTDSTKRPGAIGGWNNTNRWYVKQTHNFKVYGNNRYSGNHNTVYGGLTDSGTIYLDFATGWTFVDQRFEGVVLIEFTANARDNICEYWNRQGRADYPGVNYSHATVVDNGVGNEVINRDIYGRQWYPIVSFNADTLMMDNDTTPTLYNIKGVGGREESDLLVPPNDAQSGTITRTKTLLDSHNVLTAGSNKTIFCSDFIPVSPESLSVVEGLISGITDYTDSLRYAIIAYDRDKIQMHNDKSRQKDITNASRFQWTLSGSGTSEYYLEKAGGGDPMLNTATGKSGGVWTKGGLGYLEEGTVGALTANQYDWGDNDSLGYDTFYLRTLFSADPDTLSGQYFADECYTTVVSISKEYEAKVTTLIPHFFSLGDIVYFGNFEPAGTGDWDFNEYLGNKERTNQVVEIISATEFRIGRDTRRYTDTITRGSVQTVDYRNKFNGGPTAFGNVGMPQSDKPKFLAEILRKDVAYVRVRVLAGSAITFDGFNMAVLSPKSDRARYQSVATNDIKNALHLIPPYNPPALHLMTLSGAGTPTATSTVPQGLGQMYIDTAANKSYIAIDLSSPPVAGDFELVTST